MADEVKSQLQIHGSFGIDSGSVSIEDTTVGIVSWSDTLIICNLPDTGKGAGGHVAVQTVKGMSNKRTLSVFSLDFLHSKFAQEDLGGQGVGDSVRIGYQKWKLSWRFDISPRVPLAAFLIPFEISKSSYGKMIGLSTIFSWEDTNTYTYATIQLSGYVDLNNSTIHFKSLQMHIDLANSYGAYDTAVYLLPITFDSSGILSGFHRNYLYCECYSAFITCRDTLFPRQILFPPNPKNTVADQSQSNNFVKIWLIDHLIAFQASSPLGETTASLYTVDGRLLKRANINISARGTYTFDANGINARIAFLVLQSAKGVIAKKVMF